jgi:hypothetical protein
MGSLLKICWTQRDKRFDRGEIPPVIFCYVWYNGIENGNLRSGCAHERYIHTSGGISGDDPVFPVLSVQKE